MVSADVKLDDGTWYPHPVDQFYLGKTYKFTVLDRTDSLKLYTGKTIEYFWAIDGSTDKSFEIKLDSPCNLQVVVTVKEGSTPIAKGIYQRLITPIADPSGEVETPDPTTEPDPATD